MNIDNSKSEKILTRLKHFPVHDLYFENGSCIKIGRETRIEGTEYILHTKYECKVDPIKKVAYLLYSSGYVNVVSINVYPCKELGWLQESKANPVFCSSMCIDYKKRHLYLC